MEHQTKRRRDEIYSNSVKFMSPSSGMDSDENTFLKKSNSAMISSLEIPATHSNLKPPVKTETFSTEKPQLFRPPKIKRIISDALDNDDDFRVPPPPLPRLTKPVPQLIKPVRKHPRNPFKAPSSLLKRPIIDDSSDFRQAPKLTLPKKNKVQEQSSSKKKKLLDTLQAHQKQQDDDKDKKVCPFCSEILFPMRTAIAEALKALELKDKLHEQRQLKEMEKENSTSSFSFRMIAKRTITITEKDQFCSLHHRELVTIPDGYDKGFPSKINFEEIPKRIQRFDKELRDIISNRIKSDYRKIAEDAYKEQGVTKARSTMSVMLRFESSLPGYYGPKGSSVILDVLSTMYLKSGYLSKNLISPQLPIEFIQQVLVPEAGFRLIRQDLIKSAATIPPDCTNKAKLIMIESCDYGSAMFPIEEPEMDDLENENTSCIMLDDDDIYY